MADKLPQIILLNPELAGSPSKQLKEALSEVVPNWFLMKKGGYVNVRAAETGGMCFSWEHDAARVRLFQNLSGTSIGAGLLDIVFSVTLSPGVSDECFEWLAILEVDANGTQHFAARLSRSFSHNGEGGEVIGTASEVKLNPNKKYVAAIQFSPGPRVVTLKRAHLSFSTANVKGGEAVAISDRKSVPSNSQRRANIEEPRTGSSSGDRMQGHSAPLRLSESTLTSDRHQQEKRAGHGAHLGQLSAPASRPRLAVISWDLGHNPAGRSFLLADLAARHFSVELVGPLFKRFGSSIWGPLSTVKFPIRTFHAEHLNDFLPAAIELAKTIECDIVCVSKARMPSIVLGLLIKHIRGCPIVIDVDDHELSFFKTAEPLSLEDFLLSRDMLGDIQEIFGESWTRLSESLIPYFDGVTVSNVALRQRFGGVIVRHARDERRFVSSDAVRQRVRREFGVEENEKAILFLGTPRAHKGIFRLADALERLANDRLRLIVVGSINDKRVVHEFAKYKRAKLSFFPDQPWDRLADIVNLADTVCLLQDPASPISAFQIPAKLTDALALGIPVICTDVLPMADIPSPSVVYKITSDADLDRALSSVASSIPSTSKRTSSERQFFIQELSYAVNGSRLKTVLDEALAIDPVWKPEWDDLFRILGKTSQVSVPYGPPEWATSRKTRPPIRRGGKFDVAFFWKQNDSTIYGRRHDMLVKYLRRHERVGRIIQFDAPMSVDTLEKLSITDPHFEITQDRFVVSNTIRRFLQTDDSLGIFRRVFVYGGENQRKRFLGTDLLPPSAYAEFVAKTLDELTTGAPLLGWVCPVVFDFPGISQRVSFSFSVADLIDDQRTMSGEPSYQKRVADTYSETLRCVDLAITNCEPVRQSFSAVRSDIFVVPNAAEVYAEAEAERPIELADMRGPIAGYVGNLRDRVDVGLLEAICENRPDINIVLIGSAHRNPEVLRLRGLPNVRFLGVKPYEDALRYIRCFDVAIMPHLRNQISDRMNPLKLYVYYSLGVPIVTTDVANIDEISPYVAVARSRQEFLDALNKALAASVGRARSPRSREEVSNMSWESRVDDIMKLIDSHCN